METPEVKLPETPPVHPKQVDTCYTRKADRESKRCKPDGCEYPPVGTCIMDLPKKERKKYMWLIPDELKNDPMYNKEPEECKVDVCKMKREEREEETRREKRERKDKNDKIQQQAEQIQLLNEHLSALTKVVNDLIKSKK